MLTSEKRKKSLLAKKKSFTGLAKNYIVTRWVKTQITQVTFLDQIISYNSDWLDCFTSVMVCCYLFMMPYLNLAILKQSLLTHVDSTKA